MPGSIPEAVEYLGRVAVNGPGGRSQPQRVRCDDGRVYALKFNNPFPNHGLRVLPAEFVASRIARWVGVRIPDILVVNVGPEFLNSNPDLALRLDEGGTRQPEAGLSIASHWVDNATAVWPGKVPMTPENVRVLASVFVADNLLWMNDDHAQSYGNLLLDTDKRVWVVDWGHPFFLNGCNDWSKERLAPYLERIAPRAQPLLAIPQVRELIPFVTDRASTLPANMVADAFQEIPGEWRSPRCGGVTDHECESAHAFLLQRAGLLPDLVQGCLR